MTSVACALKLGRLALAAGVAVAIGGCSGTRTVRGHVLPGPAGIATVVQANDPRLEEQGMGGVEIRVTDGSTGMGSVAETVSNPDGSFSLRLSEATMTRRLELHAESDEIVAFHGTAHLPMDDRRLLVFVERLGEAGGEGSTR